MPFIVRNRETARVVGPPVVQKHENKDLDDAALAKARKEAAKEKLAKAKESGDQKLVADLEKKVEEHAKAEKDALEKKKHA